LVEGLRWEMMVVGYQVQGKEDVTTTSPTALYRKSLFIVVVSLLINFTIFAVMAQLRGVYVPDDREEALRYDS
jgi:hypothetical protein